MTVRLIEDGREMNQWVRTYDDPTERPPDRIGVDECDDLTLDEALHIADQYGGGEFDNETAGIVAALCVLRDVVKGWTT